MSQLIQSLLERNLIKTKLPPPWLATNTHYLTIMGSIAYGCADTNQEEEANDFDLYGMCIPPKDVIFPHLTGQIWGFGAYKSGMPKSYWGEWQNPRILDPDARGGKGRIYDFQVYNIVKYVQLCAENNPNMIDSLFTPENCVLHITQVGQVLRDNRKKFLHRGVCDRFKGYAYAQVKKLLTKEPEEGSKRDELVKKFGFDVKFAYHIVRLMEEAEQILRTGDLDLQKNREQLKSIRRGEWTLQQIIDFFEKKRVHLEEAAAESELPNKQDWNAIRDILVKCLEMHYGDLSYKAAIYVPNVAEQLLFDIKNMIINKGF